jgi:hypothetical protein
VEIDGSGIRLIDTDESLLANLPTNGDPVYVKGQVVADSLVSQTTAELRGTTSINTGGVVTVQNTVANPTAPTVVASVDSLTLTSTPANLGHGIYRDSAAGTYWLGADPTTGSYIAHEYNATTGAFVRSIPKNGSLTTYTTTSGATSHISTSASASSGSGDSQIGVDFVMPSSGSNMKITKVSAYLAGYSGDANCKNAIWSSGGTLLGESAAYTATSAAIANGNSVQYHKSLTSPLTVTGGTTYRMGFLRTSGSDGFQWDKDHTGSTKIGDGLDGNYTGTTTEAGKKPNLYITYTYDIDTATEKAKIVGIASDSVSGIIAALGSDGILHRYNRTTMAWISQTDLSAYIGGTEANAGLTFDGTFFVVTTATGTTGTDQVRLVKVTTAGVYSSTLDCTGFSVNGSTWESDRPPFPLLQPEKVLSIPLQLRFDEGYTYRLEGTERVDGFDCYVVQFEPIRRDSALYRGTVWIDERTFARIRVKAVQGGLLSVAQRAGWGCYGTELSERTLKYV